LGARDEANKSNQLAPHAADRFAPWKHVNLTRQDGIPSLFREIEPGSLNSRCMIEAFEKAFDQTGPVVGRQSKRAFG
jgi:hypothetical protein